MKVKVEKMQPPPDVHRRSGTEFDIDNCNRFTSPGKVSAINELTAATEPTRLVRPEHVVLTEFPLSEPRPARRAARIRRVIV